MEQSEEEQIAAAMEPSKAEQSKRKPVQRKAEKIAAMEQREAAQIAAAMEQSKAD